MWSYIRFAALSDDFVALVLWFTFFNMTINFVPCSGYNTRLTFGSKFVRQDFAKRLFLDDPDF